MSKKLLVKVPRTKDGVNLVYGPDKQVLYAEHIVELAAKKGLESINAKKAEHLRSIIEEIDVPDSAVKSIPNADLISRIKELEEMDVKAGYEKRIAELEAKLLGKEVNKDTGAETVTEDKAVETIAAEAGVETSAETIQKVEKVKETKGSKK